MPEFFLPDPEEIDDGHVAGKLPVPMWHNPARTVGSRVFFLRPDSLRDDDGVREMVTGLPGMCVLSTSVSTCDLDAAWHQTSKETQTEWHLKCGLKVCVFLEVEFVEKLGKRFRYDCWVFCPFDGKANLET